MNNKTVSKIQKYFTPGVLLELILLLGAALRFYDLGKESYWIDEMSTIIEAQQSLSRMITSGRLDQPPAFYIPFHFWIRLFGSGEMHARMFSALVGVSAIVLIFLIGRELFGRAVGLLSAFLMAISGFQIYYSQIARFYSYFELMTLISFLFFILALGRKKKIYFILNTLANIFVLYSHTFGVFILVAQNLFFLLRIRQYKDWIVTWLICQLSVLAAFIPYLCILVGGGRGMGGAVASNVGKLPPPLLLEPLHSIYRFILPSRRLFGPRIVLDSYLAAVIFLLIGLLIYVIRLGRDKWTTEAKGILPGLKPSTEMNAKLLLLSCWLLCPIVLPFIISFLVIPVYKDYYTISAAPAFYLLLALGIYNIRRVVPVMLSLGVLVILIVPCLHAYYVRDMNEQWQEAAAYVEQNSTPADMIVFAPNENIGIQQRTFNWYYAGQLPECGLGVPYPTPVWDTLEQCVAGHERFWVVIRGTSDDWTCIYYKTYFQYPEHKHFHLIQEHDFVGVSVLLFELAGQ